MELPIYYCKTWFRMKKFAIEPMDESLAHSRHLSGESIRLSLARTLRHLALLSSP